MSDYPADAVFALAMLTSAATVNIDIGTSHAQFAAGAGLTLGKAWFPSEDNQTPVVKITRNGAVTKSVSGPKAIVKACPYYNFNPVVGVL
jgi:glucan endo-1,3-alpha-glucosidase